MDPNSGPNGEEPPSWDELYKINLVPSELFLKFRKEIEGFRLGVNLEFYNAPINDFQTKLVLKPLSPERRWKFIYEPIHQDVRLLSKKIPVTKFLNLQDSSSTEDDGSSTDRPISLLNLNTLKQLPSSISRSLIWAALIYVGAEQSSKSMSNKLGRNQDQPQSTGRKGDGEKFKEKKEKNIEVGIGHSFSLNATGWKWKLTTCLGGDGFSRIRNKTSVGLCEGADLRFGWRADYILPEITGTLGTDEPLFNMESGRLQASLDRIEAVFTHRND